MPEVEIPTEKWTGKVKEVTLGGGGRKSVVIGGETTLPFLKFEGSIPNPPVVAVEIQDREPVDWPADLRASWGDAPKSPSSWAKRAVEVGAEVICLRLRSAHPDEGNTGPAEAKAVVSEVLSAVDLPLIVLGPDVAEKDNEVLVAASEAGKGQRLALGNCVEKNYRTIAATCIADGHIAIGKTPIDLNLAKQLNILISDLGLSPESIIVDPTTGALGYGLEYAYSIFERLRTAGLQGDAMTALPMIATVGEEVWRQKETRAAEGLPPTWGEKEQRSLVWEGITATSLLNAGADIVVLRHPKTVEMIKATIVSLMS